MAENNMDMEEFEFPDEKEAKQTAKIEIESDSDFEIEVEDDTPAEDRDKQPAPQELVEELDKDELEEYQGKTKERFKQLKKVWHDERRAKEAAYREQQEALNLAKRAIEENKQLRSQLQSGETVYVDAVKQAVEHELAIAKADFKAAYEAGDSDKLMEAQDRLTAAKIRMDKAQNYQPVYKNALHEEQNEVQIPQQQINAPDSKAVAWQERNEWFGQDEEMTSLALGLHEKLVRSGVKAGSDDYYKRIDQTMRKRFPEQFELDDVDKEEVPQTARPKASNVVAPATRSTSPKKIRLSKTQVGLAKKLGLTPEQYARELTKLEAL